MGGNAAHRLNGQGQGGDVQQQQVLPAGHHLAAQTSGLYGRAQSDTFVGVERFGRLQSEHPHDLGLNSRAAGGTAHQQYLVQVVCRQSGVAQGVSDRQGGALHQIGSQLVELGTGQRRLQMQGAVRPGGDKRQVDLGDSRTGKLFLGLFGFLPDALHGHIVAGKIDAMLGTELLRQPGNYPGVKVIAAQMIVAAGGQHLHHTVSNLDQRHVEGAAAQVVDHDFLGAAVIQPVGQGSGRRLVDDAADIESRNAAGVLGGLALGIVEIGRHGDDGLGDGFAQVGFGVGFELLQDQRADLLGGILPPVNGKTGVLTHTALDAAEGPAGVGHRLPLGGLAHQTLTVLGESHDRRRCALTLRVGDDDGLAALNDRDTAVGCAEVDSDDFAHTCISFRTGKRGHGVPDRMTKIFSLCIKYCTARSNKSCCEFVNSIGKIRVGGGMYAARGHRAENSGFLRVLRQKREESFG